MPEISLQDINDAADRKYGPLVIRDIPGGVVNLMPLTRLSKAKRGEILNLIGKDAEAAAKAAKAPAKVTAKTAKKTAAAKRAEASQVKQAENSLEVVDHLERALELACETLEQAERLLGFLDGDIGKLEFLVNEWVKVTKPGEVTPSPS